MTREQEQLNICVVRDGQPLCLGELLERAFQKEHFVIPIITDGWTERIAIQVNAGSTLKALCKTLTRVGVRIDREFARGLIDISTDRNHRSLPVLPDLFVVVESAARPRLDFSKFNVPTVFVAGDPYIGFDDHIHEVGVRNYDYVFVTQRDCIPWYKEAGCANVCWFPFACDPEIHGRIKSPLEHDVCFVGSIHPTWGRERKRMLDVVKHNFPNNWIGQAFGRKMTMLYSSSKIIFNKSILRELNMRVFEAMASGSMLVTDRIHNGLSDLFTEGKDLICYENDDEMIASITHYLEYNDEREEIAGQGNRNVMLNHTYDHRAQQILDTALS